MTKQKCLDENNLFNIDISNLKVPEKSTNTEKQETPSINISNLNIPDKNFENSEQYINNGDCCKPKVREVVNPSLDTSCLDVIKKSQYLLINNFLSEYRTNYEKELVMLNILLLDKIPTEGSTKLVNSGALYNLMIENKKVADYLISIVTELKNDTDNPLWIKDDLNNLKAAENAYGEHLGSLTITGESEVFIAKEKLSEVLVSLLSLISLLQNILGVTPTYTIIDSTYLRVDGSNIDSVLTTENKLSLVDAINEINSKVGTISQLNTDVKDNLISAINEIIDKLNDENKVISLALVEQHNKDIELEDTIDKSNKTIAAALNDLNLRKANISDLNDLQNNIEILLNTNISNLELHMEDNEMVIAAALTDLDKRIIENKSDFENTELVIAASLTDLNNRKADSKDVPEIIPISGTEINTLF